MSHINLALSTLFKFYFFENFKAKSAPLNKGHESLTRNKVVSGRAKYQKALITELVAALTSILSER